MVLLGAVVTAGIGITSRMSMPASRLGELPAAPAADVPDPPDLSLASAVDAPRAAPAVVDLPQFDRRRGGIAEGEGETAFRPPARSRAAIDVRPVPSSPVPVPASGAVEIRTSAPGVWVEIEGVAQGRAPLRVANLSPGPYVLSVTRPEGTVAQTIYVVGGEVTRIHVPGVATGAASSVGAVLAATSDDLPDMSPIGAMESSRVELPVFVLDDPPVVPVGEPEVVPGPSVPGGSSGGEGAESPPEPIDERLPPIPAPFPRPDGARIVLDLTIDASGRVQTVNVRRSDDRSVNATVVSAARRWRYRPARRGGVAVPSVRTVDIPLSVKH